MNIFTRIRALMLEYKNNNIRTIILDPIRKLTAPLNKAELYVFKLITQVTEEYTEKIGKPNDGTTEVYLKPKSYVFEVQIKCED